MSYVVVAVSRTLLDKRTHDYIESVFVLPGRAFVSASLMEDTWFCEQKHQIGLVNNKREKREFLGCYDLLVIDVSVRK